MKVDLKFLLDSVEHCTGSIVQGTLMVTVEKPHKCHSVVVLLSGGAKVQWSETYRDGDNDRTDYYSSSEPYIQEQRTVWIEENSPTGELPIGQHYFPFSFQLPQNTPPSYEGMHGHIRYELEARLVHVGLTSVFKSSRSIKVPLHVKELLPEAEMQRRYGRPVTVSRSKNLKVVLFKAGSVSTTVSIPRTGFSPGEVIPINVHVNNQSSRDLGVSSTLSRKDIFTSSCNNKNRNTKWIARTREYPVRPNASATYEDKSLRIPVDAQSTISTSSIINVGYILTVKIFIPWSFDIDMQIPIGIVNRGSVQYSSRAQHFPQPPYNPMATQPQQAAGYSTQQAPGYSSQQVPGYSSQQAAGYSSQPPYNPGYPSQPPYSAAPSYPDNSSQSAYRSSEKDEWVLVDPALPSYDEAVGKK